MSLRKSLKIFLLTLIFFFLHFSFLIFFFLFIFLANIFSQIFQERDLFSSNHNFVFVITYAKY